MPGIAMFFPSSVEGGKPEISVYDGKRDAQSIVDFMEPKLYKGLNELELKDYNYL